MCHSSSESSAGVPPAVAGASCPRSLFLLRRSLFSCALLRRSLLLGVSLSGFHFSFVLVLVRRHSLLQLGLLLRQLRSLKALPVKSNLGDADGSVGLPVSAQLLVLLLTFVVENQNLRAASFFYELADDARAFLRLSDL